MQELVGMKFKRNVYGLSDWTDTIEKAWINWRILSRTTKQPVVMVKGSVHTFELSEIVILAGPSNVFEEMQAHKIEISEWVRNGKKGEFPGKNVI